MLSEVRSPLHSNLFTSWLAIAAMPAPTRITDPIRKPQEVHSRSFRKYVVQIIYASGR